MTCDGCGEGLVPERLGGPEPHTFEYPDGRVERYHPTCCPRCSQGAMALTNPRRNRG